MTADTVLRLSGITKRFGDLVANDRIDLELARGEIVGLLGENGAGKTTLMNILFGHYVADAGRIELAGPDGVLRPLKPGTPKDALRAGIGMVHQHFALADNLTVLDNILLGAERLFAWRQDRRAARGRLEALMAHVGMTVDLDAPVRRLSVGERQRVEILKVLFRDVRVLILDEPTAVLTPQEAEELFRVLRRLAGEGLAVVFISHKLGEVLALTRRILVLRDGRLVAETPTAGASREQLAELMVGRPVQPPVRSPSEPGETVLELIGVVVLDQGRTLLAGVDLVVRRREIVGIAGVAGNGQTGLFGLLSGLFRARRGRVAIRGRNVRRWTAAAFAARHVARIPEDRQRHGVIGEMTLWENLMLLDRWLPGVQRLGWIRRRPVRAEAARVMEAYDVRAASVDTPARLLSGGNMQKLILGRELERDPELILADQPTRGLDVGAVALVHQRLLDARARGAAILLISEDLDELLLLADRIAVLHRGRLSGTMATGEVGIRELGLMMGGQRVRRDAHAA